MRSFVAALLLLAPIAAADVTLLTTDIPMSTFDGEYETAQLWQVENDPVVGGVSSSTFEVDEDGYASFEGEVEIIPYLGQPGFVKVEAYAGSFSDVSSCNGLKLVVRDDGDEDYEGYYVSFGTTQGPSYYDVGYKAPFSVPVGDEFQAIVIDFFDFSLDHTFNDGTGCADVVQNCIPPYLLYNVGTISIWGHAEEGEFELDIKGIYGTGCGDEDDLTVVDRAIMSGDLSTLVSALYMFDDVYKLIGGDGPFTLFAPTDAAFEAANINITDVDEMIEVLTYHVLMGAVESKDLVEFQTVETVGGSHLVIMVDEDKVHVNDAEVSEADIVASNGVIHIIDTVLVPPMSVLENIMASDDLVQYATLLQRHDEVEDLLSGDGPFTVFAFTDDAFDESDLDPTDETTSQAVLEYLIVSGAVFSAQLEASQDVESVEGSELTITVDDDGVTINGVAMVTMADILSSNGVVHIIDSVLTPSSISCVDDCGGRASGGCYCDSACTEFGDCCFDHVAVCVTSPTCDEHCGTKSAGECWCDDKCADYGDCCTDYQEICIDGVTSCDGLCGALGKTDDGCYCDDDCDLYEDCCDDYSSICVG